MRHAKKSTNRDFRITFKEVPDAGDQAQEDEGAEEEAENASGEESQVCEPSVVQGHTTPSAQKGVTEHPGQSLQKYLR